MAADDFERLLLVAERNAQASLLAEQNESARVAEASAAAYERGVRETEARLAREAAARTPRPPGVAGAVAGLSAALADVGIAKSVLLSIVAVVSALAGWLAHDGEVSAAKADSMVEVSDAP